MNEPGKSDRPIVSMKSANKAGDESPAAESVEKRGLAKGNPAPQTSHRTQSRKRLQQALGGIRQAVRRDRKQRMTNLWHHVCDPERLKEAYYGINRTGAAGIDGETWEMYGRELESNLASLSERLSRGSYRARPVKRHYIPKADGRQRPIGIPVLEDRIVQRAAAEVLGTVYECHFKGFSYGFRSGRSQHRALDALYVGLMRRKINWVLDADIRGCFDAIDHEWLMKFIEHLIADKRVLRHVRKWLKAGVLEDGAVRRSEEGTPQGGSISPLLCNIYLHYVLDLWIDQWRRQQAKGHVIIVRYADDFVLGFEHEAEARECLKQLRERLATFNLELHPEKTRLIEFGPHAMERRRRSGEGKPETFNFLGFTHYCDRTRGSGRYIVGRRSESKRMRMKLKEIAKELRKRMHRPVPETGRWLQRVVLGYYQYHAVPRNIQSLKRFLHTLQRLWLQSLRRRSQTARYTREKFTRLSRRWLPAPRIMHPYPEQRLCVTTQGRSPVR